MKPSFFVPEIGNLKNLDFLDLGSNRIHGSIPEEIVGCRNLTFLDLHSKEKFCTPSSSFSPASNPTAAFILSFKISEVPAGDNNNPPLAAAAAPDGGVVLFIPGFYYTRIAYYAYKGYKGFSFANIPPLSLSFKIVLIHCGFLLCWYLHIILHLAAVGIQSANNEGSKRREFRHRKHTPSPPVPGSGEVSDGGVELSKVQNAIWTNLSY
ncbi:Leucine-rich repeat receptor-like serine/threonine-protein kinase RGI4 [Linum perenne]